MEKESRMSRHMSSERLAAIYRWFLIHVCTVMYNAHIVVMCMEVELVVLKMNCARN